jgi:Sel1 repeat
MCGVRSVSAFIATRVRLLLFRVLPECSLVGPLVCFYGCVTNGGICTATARPASDRVTVIRVMGDIGNPFSDAGHLLREGRVSEALRLLKQADESGDILASMPLVRTASGELWVGDVIVTAGLDEAAQVRQTMAEVCARDGRYSEAASWYQKAVDTPGFGMGHDWAATGLAYLYLNGKGVPQDRSRARELLGTASGGDGAKYVELFDNGLLPPTADDLSGSFADRALATKNQRSLDSAPTQQGEIDEGQSQSGTSSEKTLQAE